MPRHLHRRFFSWLAAGFLVLLTASVVGATSLEDLQRENREWRAQLAALASSHPTSPGMSHDGSDEHAGEAGHDDYCYDYIYAFREHHETVDGYPLMHMFRTEHAWLERKVQMAYVHADGADGGEVDESEFEFEFFYALNNRIAVLLEVPLISLNPNDEPNTSGVGDLEVGVQYLAFDGEISMLAFGFNVITPTGDADRGLGGGNTVLIPKAYLWHDLGDAWGLQADCSFEMPVSVEDPEDTFVYNVGVNRVLPGSECCRVFRYLTASLEVNSHTALNGSESGLTVVNLTPGLRWMMREHDQCGVAYSFPITGDRDSQGDFIFSYIVHF